MFLLQKVIKAEFLKRSLQSKILSIKEAALKNPPIRKKGITN